MVDDSDVVEVFIDDFTQPRIYGWQCFACSQEGTGFLSVGAAELAAEDHERTHRDD